MAARYFEEAAHALAYSKFRPGPPASLISRIVNFLQEKYSGSLNSAIDVGCGSGQSTRPLAKYFANVNGFDVSEAQIKEAIQKNNLNNVSYKVNPAESLPFKDASAQLITSCQASHWFDLPKFYKEADRILVQNGVLALYGYYFPHSLWKDKDFHEILISVYENDTKGYWTEERFDVDNGYTDKKYIIPFGECLREDNFFTETKATVRDLEGYITSWSGFQRLKTQKGEEAGQQILNNFVKRIMNTVGNDMKPEDVEVTLRYGFFLILGRKT
ncbi:UNVERIFIED_CONTAM: hypothetical protein RMT77_017064 [Armadillidium vulgare]